MTSTNLHPMPSYEAFRREFFRTGHVLPKSAIHHLGPPPRVRRGWKPATLTTGALAAAGGLLLTLAALVL